MRHKGSGGGEKKPHKNVDNPAPPPQDLIGNLSSCRHLSPARCIVLIKRRQREAAALEGPVRAPVSAALCAKLQNNAHRRAASRGIGGGGQLRPLFHSGDSDDTPHRRWGRGRRDSSRSGALNLRELGKQKPRFEPSSSVAAIYT